MKGYTVVFTGELLGISREKAERILTDNGAKCTKSVSGKTSLLIYGE